MLAKNEFPLSYFVMLQYMILFILQRKKMQLSKLADRARVDGSGVGVAGASGAVNEDEDDSDEDFQDYDKYYQ